MNQTVRNPIPSFEPIEQPAPISTVIQIAKGCGNSACLITEAVQFAPSEDLPSWFSGRWVLRQRHTTANLIRESTATYATSKEASYAYWYVWLDDPVDWEPWVAPAWATTGGV